MCGSDPDLSATVRVSGAGPWPAATAVVRGDTTSDGRVVGPADHRGLPLVIGTCLPGARQSSCLRTCLQVSGEGHGYPRPSNLATIAMAKSVCAAFDRHRAPRVSRPDAGL